MLSLGPLIQNFSVPAGNSETIEFIIDPEGFPTDTLEGTSIFWEVWEQEYGIPIGDPIIRKVCPGGRIIIPESPPMTFLVFIDVEDTMDLLRNYYHEACVYDDTGNPISVTVGIMTVTQTKIREDV